MAEDDLETQWYSLRNLPEGTKVKLLMEIEGEIDYDGDLACAALDGAYEFYYTNGDLPNDVKGIEIPQLPWRDAVMVRDYGGGVWHRVANDLWIYPEIDDISPLINTSDRLEEVHGPIAPVRQSWDEVK